MKDAGCFLWGLGWGKGMATGEISFQPNQIV